MTGDYASARVTYGSGLEEPRAALRLAPIATLSVSAEEIDALAAELVAIANTMRVVQLVTRRVAPILDKRARAVIRDEAIARARDVAADDELLDSLGALGAHGSVDYQHEGVV